MLAGAAIFAGVEPAAAQALTAALRPVEVTAGHVFFTEGERGDRLYVIVSGKVTIGRRAPQPDERQSLCTVLGPSEVFGELEVFDPGPRSATATALTKVCAADVDRATLRSWIRARPEIADRLLRVLARRLRRTNHDVSALMFTDVTGRVATALLRLAQQFGVREGDGVRVTHDVTQEELAQLVGASRESVCKALGAFSARGWIMVQGKSILIAEMDHLTQRARPGAMAR